MRKYRRVTPSNIPLGKFPSLLVMYHKVVTVWLKEFGYRKYWLESHYIKANDDAP